jgi:hypothetical protein
MEETMKTILIVAAVAAMTTVAAQAQPAMSSGPTCLRSTDIKDTKTPDSRTIIFDMNDGSVYRNDLKNDCPQLNFNGYAYVATPPDQICGNLQAIKVLRTGSVCLLGPFTKVKDGRIHD